MAAGPPGLGAAEVGYGHHQHAARAKQAKAVDQGPADARGRALERPRPGSRAAGVEAKGPAWVESPLGPLEAMSTKERLMFGSHRLDVAATLPACSRRSANAGRPSC